MRKCPYCAEEIKDEAVKCKHCHEFLNKPEEVIKQETSLGRVMISKVHRRSAKNKMGLGGLMIVAGLLLTLKSGSLIDLGTSAQLAFKASIVSLVVLGLGFIVYFVGRYQSWDH